MHLIYADNATLYVPVERLDLVQKYSGGEAHDPPLDKLGGVGWEKTKAKAKKAMRDMAEELLKLYAERKLVEGHSYPPDTPWQREFEDGFEYQLTEDRTRKVPSKTSRRTWKPRRRWIGSSAAMLATVRPRSQSGPSSRQ
jgi:transcription-repair coupling factor (superfamily II helicase)